MWWPDRRQALAGLAACALGGTLAGCGFRPVYQAGSPSRAALGEVALGEVTVIGADAGLGFDFRERFETRTGPVAAPRWQLAVTLGLDSEGRAIREDRAITRFDVTGFADYRLTDTASGTILVEDRLKSLTAYNATANAFATAIAQRDAERRLVRTLADQLLLRLTTTAGDWRP